MTGSTVRGRGQPFGSTPGSPAAPRAGAAPRDPGATAPGTPVSGTSVSGRPSAASPGFPGPPGPGPIAPRPAAAASFIPPSMTVEDPPLTKAELRRRLLTLRRVGSTAPESAALTERVLALPELDEAQCVAAYVGMADEPDTTELLARLRARGVRVLLPVVRADLDLDFREHNGTLVPGAMGTREPPPSAPLVDLSEADVIILPALAADPTGNRLGRGGGSYDRALTRARPGTPVIALLHDREVLDRIPREEHDRLLTHIITPTRTLRTTAP